MRTALAAVAGVAVTVVSALILGEYPFVGLTPYVAAVAVPAVTATALLLVADRRPARCWAAAGILSAAGIGWALWISTGRGVDPTPVGGWVAIALGVAWPLARAAWLARRSSQGRVGEPGAAGSPASDPPAVPGGSPSVSARTQSR